jgi:hypothetical protein
MCIHPLSVQRTALQVQLDRLEAAEAEEAKGRDDAPFELWSILEAELAPRWLLRQLGHAHHAVRASCAKARAEGRGWRAALVRPLLWALTWRLGDSTNTRLEAALQLWRLLGSGGMVRACVHACVRAAALPPIPTNHRAQGHTGTSSSAAV